MEDIFTRNVKDMEEKFGCKFTLLTKEEVISELEISDSHRNVMNLVYGGIVYNLADISAGTAFYINGVMGPTVSGTINYLNGTKNVTKLICHSQCIRRGNTISFVESNIYNETEDTLIAQASFVYYAFK